LFSSRDYQWKGRELFRKGSRAPVARIEPDPVYPGMARIAWPDGERSDRYNRTRAKANAISADMASTRYERAERAA
jgi:hypothetical protein